MLELSVGEERSGYLAWEGLKDVFILSFYGQFYGKWAFMKEIISFLSVHH